MTKLHYLFLRMDVILFRFWMLFHGGFRNGVLWVCLYLGKNISPFINRKSNKSIIFAVANCDCACGEIGRRARLRIWCSDTCRFESYQAHRKRMFRKKLPLFLFPSSTDGDGLSRIGKSLRPRASGMIYCQHEFKREFKQKHAS